MGIPFELEPISPISIIVTPVTNPFELRFPCLSLQLTFNIACLNGGGVHCASVLLSSEIIRLFEILILPNGCVFIS